MRYLNISIGLLLLVALGCSDNQPTVVDNSDDARAQISNLTKGAARIPPDLISWWPGDGNSLDYQGGNHGIGNNGVGYTHGFVTKAFCFDGVDDYLIAPGDGINNLQELTIETWVKLEGEPGGQPSNRIERFVTLGPHEKAVLRHDGDNDPGQLHFYLNFGTTGAPNWDDYHVLRHLRYPDSEEPPALLTGIFYHVAGTFDGSVMRLFFNGEEVKSQAVDDVSKGLIEGEQVELSTAGEPLSGLLDEVSIYGRALAPEEIKAIYDAGRAGKRPKIKPNDRR